MNTTSQANFWSANAMSGKKMVLKRSGRAPLFTFTNNYTQVNAYNLALFANLAYAKSEDTIETFFKKLNGQGREFDIGDPKVAPTPFLFTTNHGEGFSIELDNIVFQNDTDTQFYYAASKNQILIVVRGTTSIKDWTQNAQASQVNFNEGHGQVHKGFYECFQSTKTDIRDFLSSKLKSDAEVIVAGHSLGGAIATLIAAYVRTNFTDKVMLYTYGSPRVGTSSFKSHYSSSERFTYHRMVNNNDIVPLVPMPGLDLKPYLLPFGLVPGAKSLLPLAFIDLDGDVFTHLGTCHHIVKTSENYGVMEEEGSDPIHVKVETSDEDQQEITLDSLMNAGNGIEDHGMPNYISFLEADYRIACQNYLSKGNDDILSTENDIRVLENEVAEIEGAKKNCMDQSAVHKELAEEKKDDSFLSSYHAHEASKLDYKVACMNVEIARRNETIAHYKGYVDYQRNNPENKSVILKKLVDKPSDENMEKEITYHGEL